MNMVIGVEEIFSYCQRVLRNMGLPEIKLFHPSQSMSYQDFQRMYGQTEREETQFQNRVISSIADVLEVYGQGLARDIFVAYIEDSERIDSIVFDNSDYVAFKKELPKFLYVMYASVCSRQQQLHPQKCEITQSQIVGIDIQPPEVHFQLKNIETQQTEMIQTKSKVELIQILKGLDIHVSSIRPFVHIGEDFVQQMLYGRDVFVCYYLNTKDEMACLMNFFPSRETAQKGFQRELFTENGRLQDCAIQHDNLECFNSLLHEDMTVYKKRTLGGTLEIYSYQYMATVAFRNSSNQHHVGQILGWFDDRGMHWKKDIPDTSIIQEISRVLRNLDAEIGCRPQKPSRRRRR